MVICILYNQLLLLTVKKKNLPITCARICSYTCCTDLEMDAFLEESFTEPLIVTRTNMTHVWTPV